MAESFRIPRVQVSVLARICQDNLTTVELVSLENLRSNPLEALRQVAQSEAQLEGVRRDLVGKCRAQGFSWEAIASALGISRQSAWQYYNKRFAKQ
jgi:hypothetical protein